MDQSDRLSTKAKHPGRPNAMHTLVILHSGAVTGPPQHVFSWLSPLAARGSVSAIVPAAGSAADLYATIGRTTVLDFEPLTYPRRLRALVSYPARFAADVRRFGRLIRQLEPDLVVSVTASLPAALLAARMQRVPTVVFVGEIFDKGLAPSRGRALGAAAAIRMTAALPDALVCCSQTVAGQFARTRTRLLRTIYPGVDGTYANGDGERFRAAHGLREAAPCLAVIGNVTPARGQDIVIRALPALRRDFPEVRCVIAGVPHPRPGDLAYRQELGRLARRLGVDDAVVFVGLVDSMADLYAASDIVVNPARCNESFGRVAVEALSAGRPVVAAAVGAVAEVVRDGQEALLFAAEDHEDLRNAITRLWRDRRLREKLVRNGRRRVAVQFREDLAVEAFGDVVDRVLAARGGAATPTRPAPAK